MISQNIAERPINISSIPNNFKSFIKWVYQKQRTQDLNKKKDENNYFRTEISLRQEQLLILKLKMKIAF